MIEGTFEPEFWSVTRVFKNLLPKDGQGGAAVCVYFNGRPVVDVWAGTRNEHGTPWTPDTLALSYSTTKGIASTLVHILADRGQIDYDQPISRYWPEFAQAGKADITVRQLMSHQAGLFHIREIIDHASRMTDWEHMVDALAAAAPCHPPGQAHGYHGLTYGWLVGELVQRVTGKGFSELLQSELAEPLGLDGLYVGIPDEALDRRATQILSKLQSQEGGTEKFERRIERASRFFAMARVPIDLRHLRSALLPHGMETLDFNSSDFQRVPIPSMNGMFNARSLARMYGALANGGELDGTRLMSRDTVDRARQRQNRGMGLVVPFSMQWRLGYHRPFTLVGNIKGGFGHFGFGGSGAWADPTRNLAVALVLNSGVGTPFGDTRIVRLSTAAMRAADAAVRKSRRNVNLRTAS